MYLDKELIENKLYQITNQFDERQIISIKFYLELLIKTHPFNGVNGITCKILYSNHSHDVSHCSMAIQWANHPRY